MADGGNRLRAEVAGFRLPFAEIPHVADGSLGSSDALGRTDLSLRRGLRSAARQHDKNDRKPERDAQEEPHEQNALSPVRPRATLTGSVEVLVPRTISILRSFDAKKRQIFRPLEIFNQH